MEITGKKVSILIPAYNAAAFIDETIQSALRQLWEDKEIIVVDDGSTDDTYERARKYEPEIKVFKQENRGASAARNRCFEESTGNYIQYLDADDTLATDKISSQMKLVSEYGDTCIYSGRWALFYITEDAAEFHPNELWKDYNNPADWLITAWTKEQWVHPTVWLTPRQLIVKAGQWNEALSLHDDGEFFCRVLLQSEGIYFSWQARSYYRKGIGNSLSSARSEKAVLSHFKICELYENHLLSYANTLAARRACATNYLAFYYFHFPGNKEIRNCAREAARRLGGANVSPKGTRLFSLLKNMVGWKAAKHIENFYYLNRTK